MKCGANMKKETTNKKLSYDELEKKVQRLENKLMDVSNNAAKLKSIMLSNVHHEIRTPLNAIQGYSNLLAQNDLTEEKKKLYLSHIQKGNEKLIEYIDDLIEASMLELGNLKIEETECYINQLFDNVYKYFNTLRRSDKNHVLCLLVNKEVTTDEFMILIDEMRLSKVLYKLLKTVFDYHEFGVIEFGYTIDELKLYFFLNDSRNSILRNVSNNVLTLQQFDEIKAAATDHFDLSITIANKIISQMHGQVWVENMKEKGYKILFEVPIRIPSFTRDYQVLRKDISIFT